jgi:hypothetical protein
MDPSPMRKLLNKWKFYSGVYGWEFLLASVLFVGAILYSLFVTMPRISKLHEYEQKVGSLSEVKGTSVTGDPRESSANKLSAFYRFFPAEGESVQEVGMMLNYAAENQLVLGKIEYAFDPKHALGITKYQVTCDVKGSYTGIRKFVNSVLNGIPTAALNEVQFKREDPAAATVQSHLRFSFYLRSEVQ